MPEIEQPSHDEDEKEWERAMNEGWVEKEAPSAPLTTSVIIEPLDESSEVDLFGYDG